MRISCGIAAVCAAHLLACGQVVTPGGDGGSDTGSAVMDANTMMQQESGVSDAGMGQRPDRTTPPRTDAGALPPDDIAVPPLPDVPVLLPDGMVVPPEAGTIDPVFPDAMTEAGTVVPDAALPSLEGRWRQIALQFRRDDGTSVTLLDRNRTTEFGPGFRVEARVNGTLVLEPSRLTLATTLYLNDHIFARQEATDPEDGLSMYGLSAPGMLSGTTFAVGRDLVQFEFDDRAQTLTLIDRDSGNRSTYQRAPGLRAGAGYSPAGQASFIGMMGAVRIPNLRFSLAWDTAGTGAPAFSNVVVQGRSTAFNTIDFSLPMEMPPAAARVRIGTTTASVAYFFAFEDQNSNNRYDDGMDPVRGISQLALVFIDRVDDAALASSALRLLAPGASMCAIVPDYGGIRSALVPLDNTVNLGPDLALGPSSIANLFPDLLR